MNRSIGLSHGAAVLINDRDPQLTCLWLVHTIYQLAEIDAENGTFPPVNDVRLPGESTQPYQFLVGDAADIVAEAIDAVFAASKQGEQMVLPQFPGIASCNLRRGDNVCTIVVRHSAGRVLFAVVYSVPQLQKLQRNHFPDYPDDVAAIQGVARLPDYSDTTEFVVSGPLAANFIIGCLLTRVLRINFRAAPEH